MANDNVSALLALKRGSGSGGGSDFFEVWIDKTSGTTTANKTYYEIQQAQLAGKLVVFSYADDDVGWSIMAFAKYELTGFTAYFYEGNSGFGVTIAADDSVSVTPYSSVPITTAVTGSTPTIAAEDNHIYECGELSSLTVTAIDNPGSFIIRFASGATATTTTLPAGMVFPEAFAPEANTRYEISWVDGYALAAGWPYTPPAAEE